MYSELIRLTGSYSISVSITPYISILSLAFLRYTVFSSPVDFHYLNIWTVVILLHKEFYVLPVKSSADLSVSVSKTRHAVDSHNGICQRLALYVIAVFLAACRSRLYCDYLLYRLEFIVERSRLFLAFLLTSRVIDVTRPIDSISLRKLS